MKTRKLYAPSAFEAGFQAIRDELDIPRAFPPEVLSAAETAVDRFADIRSDRRDLSLVAIDPPGAMDLDQAFYAEAITDSAAAYRVFYAIADVGAFIESGDPIDLEARRRGTTYYSPDLRTPLHPPTLSEDRASLLAGTDKPALLWTIDLDVHGAPVNVMVERSLVTVREAISYTEAQRRIDAGINASLNLLKKIGTLRQIQEVKRGGISLNLPSQEVVERNGTYDLQFDTSIPVEGWNAQMSLLTGIVAGRKMCEAKVGVLRTLPSPRHQDLRRLRREAEALEIPWPEDQSYPEMIRTVTPDSPRKAAFLLQAARSFRGAGYVFIHGELPQLSEHGAIASHYAHVTAPLRRLVDRPNNEVLLALFAGIAPGPPLIADLEELPSQMGKARSRESAFERALVDYAETMVLSGRVGQRFDASVVSLHEKRDLAYIQILDPAIESSVPLNGHQLGDRITVTLAEADPVSRTLSWE
ncbi:MAG: RNB domain-containing ribonuclease [Acidimicrobiales bacterium]|nr:RNB domain-containing ribonuclease [Acidimicrobiales bacterium]